MKYEIRKDGRVYAAWERPQLTPPAVILRSMARAGYNLYTDGKRAKREKKTG